MNAADDLAVMQLVAAWLARHGHPADRRYVLTVREAGGGGETLAKLTIVPRLASASEPFADVESDFNPSPLQMRVLEACDEGPKSRKQLLPIMGSRVYSKGRDGLQPLIENGLLERMDGDKYRTPRDPVQ